MKSIFLCNNALNTEAKIENTEKIMDDIAMISTVFIPSLRYKYNDCKHNCGKFYVAKK